MFRSVCKRIPPWRPAVTLSLNQDLGFLQLHNYSATLEDDNRLFIIDYLKHTCGMSQDKAESASRKAVDEVKSMGFNPMKASFCGGVYVFGWNNESWEKMGVYKSVGLSDADIMAAFQRDPFCMMHSADKIFKTMDFLVNRMGFEPSSVMKWPPVLSYTLEKRMVPRCIVYKALLANDLVPKNFTLRLLLEYQEKKFMSTFVEPFKAQVPGLLLMYKNSFPASK